MNWITNKLYIKVIGAAGAIALSITGYMAVEGQSYKPIDLVKNDSGAASRQESFLKKEEAAPKPLMVQISGCVKAPGIYTMQEGQRVMDAIELAGGATMEIDDKSINLVAKVKDGQKIYFQPKKMESPTKNDIDLSQQSSGKTEENQAQTVKDKININTATATELQRLPGIGEYYAKKIIEYRTAHGPFKDTGSIIKVTGIGNSRFDQIKAYITVR